MKTRNLKLSLTEKKETWLIASENYISYLTHVKFGLQTQRLIIDQFISSQIEISVVKVLQCFFIPAERKKKTFESISIMLTNWQIELMSFFLCKPGHHFEFNYN